MNRRAGIVIAIVMVAAAGGWLLLSEEGQRTGPPALDAKEAETATTRPSPAVVQASPGQIRPREVRERDDRSPEVMDSHELWSMSSVALSSFSSTIDERKRQLVTFRFTNASGSPVENGRVLADESSSSRTDADGRTQMMIPVGTTAVVAGAPGLQVRKVPLPAKLPEIMDVRLEPSVTLLVRVRHEDPSVPLHAQLELSWKIDEPMIGQMWTKDFEDVRGAVPINAGCNDHSMSRRYEVRPGEDVVVSGFEGGAAVEAAVQDPHHHVIMSERITLPAAGQAHGIEMIVRTKPRAIRGTVLDDQGKPLAGARVCGIKSYRWMWIVNASLTDASGNFEVRDLYASEITASVTGDGHVPQTVVVAQPDQPVTIRLERGRELTVCIKGGPPPSFRGTVRFDVNLGTTYAPYATAENIAWFIAPCRAGVICAIGASGRSTAVAIDAEQLEVSITSPDKEP